MHPQTNRSALKLFTTALSTAFTTLPLTCAFAPAPADAEARSNHTETVANLRAYAPYKASDDIKVVTKPAG